MYMTLRTKRLLLRPVSVLDVQSTNEYAMDKENTKYLMRLPNKSVEETQRFLACASEEWQKEEPTFYEFALIHDSRHIGGVGIYLNEDRTEGELGWLLNKKYWGNGFGTEAALAIKSFAIEHLKLKKLVAYCDSRNLSSVHVMEKIGLKFDSKGERKYLDERGVAGELKYSCDLDVID